MVSVRHAAASDLELVLRFTRALNVIEHIEIDDDLLRRALSRLLADTMLGVVFVIERASHPIGHAVVTYGYDLEFGGRDAFLTEFFVDESSRGSGAGTVALELITTELRALDVRAVHLGVRAENPAKRLYERAGFEVTPRVYMTKRL